jgi:hypothetical protein
MKSYLYISSFFPFNHKYFDISTGNDQNGTLTVETWHNDAWVSAADIIDYTNNGNRSLEQSGNIVFTVDEDEGWSSESDSSDIAELSTTKVYGAYWMRFGFDASSDSAASINYIGHRFADGNGLYSLYPMLDNSSLLARFQTGKTDWNSQLINASVYIIADLKSRNLILSKDQILDIKRFEYPCIHKAAEMIFMGLGISYKENEIAANKAYHDIMNTDDFGIDLNGNSRLDRAEKRTVIRRMRR